MKTALKKEKFSEIKKNVKSKRTRAVLESAAYFAAAFILAQNAVLQSVSPFAVSLISVSKKKNYFYSAAGAALGYLVFRPQDFARCAAAVLIVFLGSLALDLADCKTSVFLPMMISFCAVAATGVVVDIKTGGAAADYALTAAQSILAGGASFFFYRALNCSLHRFRFRALPASDLTCIIISASLLLMSLSRITIAGFSPARCIAALLVLLTVRYGSDRLGIMLALCVGFAFHSARMKRCSLPALLAFRRFWRAFSARSGRLRAQSPTPFHQLCLRLPQGRRCISFLKAPLLAFCLRSALP